MNFRKHNQSLLTRGITLHYITKNLIQILSTIYVLGLLLRLPHHDKPECFHEHHPHRTRLVPSTCPHFDYACTRSRTGPEL